MTQEPKETGDMQDYIAYLLRMWREKGSDVNHWRASLQDPHSSKKVGFTHLENLFDFLQRETGEPPDKKGSRSCSEAKGGE